MSDQQALADSFRVPDVHCCRCLLGCRFLVIRCSTGSGRSEWACLSVSGRGDEADVCMASIQPSLSRLGLLGGLVPGQSVRGGVMSLDEGSAKG